MWRSYLANHSVRLSAAISQEQRLGVEFHGLHVVEQALGYETLSAGTYERPDRIHTCFPGSTFNSITANQVFRRTRELLEQIGPEVVFCPATPFPEGMAALSWRARYGGRVYIMDDSWEFTDRSGLVRRAVKRMLHGGIDGVFVPGREYQSYWVKNSVPSDRVLTGVNVIDNDAFRRPLSAPSRARRFLFVGRSLPIKQLRLAIEAYACYRDKVESPWQFHVVGPNDPKVGENVAGVRFLGTLQGLQLKEQYWSASALVVPSDQETWAFVVNEAMAAGLPVIASRGVGAARSLITEGVTGWTFEPKNSIELTSVMKEVANIGVERLKAVADAALAKITNEYALSNFADSIEYALKLPRRAEPGLLTRLATTFWRGHARNY